MRRRDRGKFEIGCAGCEGWAAHTPKIMPNRLASEQSPYLLQHRDNPVDWFPWGPEAFDRARETNRPVFLSIGYSTCHWCHVMARESFSDPAIASLLNGRFISIKLDREERPDVDRLYMTFLQSTTGSGGWPMSVWLTPEGEPFFGGTYYPPTDRYGRPGFPTLLLRIAEVWEKDESAVRRQGAEMIGALGRVAEVEAPADFSPTTDPAARALVQFADSYDPEHGGFGGAPKFPRPVALNFLFRAGLLPGDSSGASEMALGTLRKMAAGGMRDHLGGGYHRYSVDRFWHVPHFEKMLYDQAQLAISFIEAYQITGESLFAGQAEETIAYVARDLTSPDGGFYSAEDAESFLVHGHPEKAEGAFFVWTMEEIQGVLDAGDAAIFCSHYGVQAGGNAPEGSDPHGEFADKNILIERRSPEETARLMRLDPADVSASLSRSRATLFALREKRPRPHRDDKVLAAWNGLMISACARVGAALSDDATVALGVRAAGFLRENLCDATGRELSRTWRGGIAAVPGFAEDYAFVIQGLLDLYDATADTVWLAWALDLQGAQDEHFWDETGGGYFGSRAGDPLVKVRMKEDYDGAEPSANSVSALNLLRLAGLLHAPEMRERAGRILAAFRAPLGRVPTAMPQMLVALLLASRPSREIVLVAEEADATTERILLAARKAFDPARSLSVVIGGNDRAFFEKHSPAIAAMRAIDGRPTLYVCEDFACRAPITDPGAAIAAVSVAPAAI